GRASGAPPQGRQRSRDPWRVPLPTAAGGTPRLAGRWIHARRVHRYEWEPLSSSRVVPDAIVERGHERGGRPIREPRRRAHGKPAQKSIANPRKVAVVVIGRTETGAQEPVQCHH